MLMDSKTKGLALQTICSFMLVLLDVPHLHTSLVLYSLFTYFYFFSVIGERGNKSRVYTREEVLHKLVKEVKRASWFYFYLAIIDGA